LKLTQFYKNGSVCLGIVVPEGVIDVQAEAERKRITAPASMIELICGGECAMERLQDIVSDPVCFTDAPLAPVVTGCEKVLCIGLNYRQHAAECNLPIPAFPVLFNKFPSSLTADGSEIHLLPDYREYDYEAELVAVIGKRCRNASPDDALSYVFGYTCGNDFSTRDLQFARGNQWILSKSFDGFAPIGPCLVTADCLNPNHLSISSTVNGEIRQNSNTSDMIFSVADIISDLSRHMTLMPGDLIFTGTPQGVMHGYPADQKNWLKPGDQVTVTIEGIGTLRNQLI